MATIFIVLMCFITLASSTPIFAVDLSESGLRESFASFALEHKREYSCQMEYEKRYQIFKSNVLRAADWQQETKSAVYGVTKFSDRTDEENFASLTGFKAPTSKQRAIRPFISTVQPSPKTDLRSFDFRKTGLVTPVQDQGDCGSCFAQSVVASYGSGAKKLAYPSPFDLSVQQILDCDLDNRGCGGGNPEEVGEYLNKLEVTGGLMSNTDYPYEALTHNQCFYNSSNVHVPFNWYRWIISPCDDDGDCSRQDGKLALQKVIEIDQVPSVCVYANSKWFSYVSGIFDDIKCYDDFAYLNHCVGLVGYDALEGAVILQNSWGDWGVKGSIYIKFDPRDADYSNLCGIFDYMSYFNPQTKK